MLRGYETALSLIEGHKGVYQNVLTWVFWFIYSDCDSLKLY